MKRQGARFSEYTHTHTYNKHTCTETHTEISLIDPRRLHNDRRNRVVTLAERRRNARPSSSVPTWPSLPPEYQCKPSAAHTRRADWPAISFTRIEKWRTKLRRRRFGKQSNPPALTASKSFDDQPPPLPTLSARGGGGGGARRVADRSKARTAEARSPI